MFQKEKIRHSVIQTLAYMDQFDHPLTARELYQWLWNPPEHLSFSHFFQILEQGLASVETKEGWYFLPGREEIIHVRQARIGYLEPKMKIAKRGAAVLGMLPFIDGVFVCNTVAGGVLSKESDIDVFVIVRSGRLWTARFIATLILTLAGLRRAGKDVADKICLSFYITEKHLNLKDIRMGNDDIYLYIWMTQLLPLFDPQDLLTQFQEKNGWVRAHLPHGFRPVSLSSDWRVSQQTGLRYVLKKGIELLLRGRIGSWIEGAIKRLQQAKMNRNKTSVQHQQTSAVILSDTMLKFHETDRRAHYRDEWKKICVQQHL